MFYRGLFRFSWLFWCFLNLFSALLNHLLDLLRDSFSVFVNFLEASPRSERLWCQFEFSAFLKKRAEEQVVVIRPTFLGPCSCVLFIGISILTAPATTLPRGDARIPYWSILLVGLISGYCILAALRGYFRMVEALKEKMRSFSFDGSRSACCDLDHVLDGRRILCDRQIAKECVSIWFGNVEAFEDYVRSKVMENLVMQLETRVFTRSWSLSVTIPFMWTTFDLCATWLFAGEYLHALSRFGVGLVMWFLCGPIFADCFIFLAQTFSGKPPKLAYEILKNMAVLLLAMLPLGAMAASVFFFHTSPWGGPMQRLGVFGAIWSLLGLTHSIAKEMFSRNRASMNGSRGHRHAL